MTPDQVGRMSLGQWVAIVHSHRSSNDKLEPPTEEEFEKGVFRAQEIINGRA